MTDTDTGPDAMQRAISRIHANMDAKVFGNGDDIVQGHFIHKVGRWEMIDTMPPNILVLVRDDKLPDRSHELAMRTKSYLPWFSIEAVEWCYIPGTEPLQPCPVHISRDNNRP